MLSLLSLLPSSLMGPVSAAVMQYGWAFGQVPRAEVGVAVAGDVG